MSTRLPSLLVLVPFVAACAAQTGSTDAGADHITPADAAADVPSLDTANDDIVSSDTLDDVGFDTVAPDAAGDVATDTPRDTTTPDAGMINPFPGSFASPSIVRVGSTYHVYVAQQNINGRHYHIPHATFTADGNFTFVGEALPSLGAQVVDPGEVWAPGVARIDATHWVLYYSSHLAGTTAKKCIFRAHASSPDGPFVDDYGGPLACEAGSLWTIDAYPVLDARGNWNLAARIDQTPPPNYTLGAVNSIQVRQLGPLGENFAPGSNWIELTNNQSSWEQPVMENAGIVRLGPPSGAMPHWYVFYSARSFSDATYAIGYADCGTGLTDGNCTKVTTNGPWLETDAAAGLFGPGTPTFYTDESGQPLMSIQAWVAPGGNSNTRNRGGWIMRTYSISVDESFRAHVRLVRIDGH